MAIAIWWFKLPVLHLYYIWDSFPCLATDTTAMPRREPFTIYLYTHTHIHTCIYSSRCSTCTWLLSSDGRLPVLLNLLWWTALTAPSDGQTCPLHRHYSLFPYNGPSSWRNNHYNYGLCSLLPPLWLRPSFCMGGGPLSLLFPGNILMAQN